MTNSQRNFTPKYETRLPAEWEPQDAVMLVWPHEKTDWAYMLDEAKACFAQIITAIIRQKERVILVVPEDEQIHFCPASESHLLQIVRYRTNDTWARDICPIVTFKGSTPIINDFKFNGWGLKFAADFDNLLSSFMHKQQIFNGKYANRLNFVLEGGAIESDGKGTLLTTSQCLLSKNRNGGLSKSQITQRLKKCFGAKKILWLDFGFLEGDDTDSHIDTLARFAPNNNLLYTATDRHNDTHYAELKQMERQLDSFSNADGDKFNLIPLPLPNPIFDENGCRLPATYANFLIGNGFVLVPTYGQPENDKKAIAAILQAFPSHNIIGINCSALIRQHGSLHCVTMQLPKKSYRHD